MIVLSFFWIILELILYVPWRGYSLFLAPSWHHFGIIVCALPGDLFMMRPSGHYGGRPTAALLGTIGWAVFPTSLPVLRLFDRGWYSTWLAFASLAGGRRPP